MSSRVHTGYLRGHQSAKNEGWVGGFLRVLNGMKLDSLGEYDP